MENENFFPGYNPENQEPTPAAPEYEAPAAPAYEAPVAAPAYEAYEPVAPAAQPTDIGPVCGAVNPAGSTFCSNCGSTLSAQQPAPYAPVAEQPLQYDPNGVQYTQQAPGYYPPAAPQKKKKKKTVLIIVAVVAVLLVAIIGIGIAGSDSGSSGSSGSSGGSSYSSGSYESYYINMVKNAKNSTYGITYGSAFNSFFSSPSWEYFESTTGKHVVEFEGDFLYSGVPTTARIQFTLDLSGGTFTATYLAFDEEAQTKLMLSAMIEKVFESY